MGPGSPISDLRNRRSSGGRGSPVRQELAVCNIFGARAQPSCCANASCVGNHAAKRTKTILTACFKKKLQEAFSGSTGREILPVQPDKSIGIQHLCIPPSRLQSRSRQGGKDRSGSCYQ